MEGKPTDKDLDIKERIEAAQKDFRKVTEKYQVDLVSYPTYRPHPNGHFVTVIATKFVDTKYLSVPSPIQQDNIIEK